jgi:hypothetical protein
MAKVRKNRKSLYKTQKPDATLRLEQIPNVGPKIAGLIRRLGVKTPEDINGRDPYRMYEDLCRLGGKRYDPCVLDVFISAVDFMGGGPAKPWWKFTAERKRRLASLSSLD